MESTDTSQQLANNHYFDLNHVYECFNKCLTDDDNIDLGFYLEAYQELCKFCSLTGSVFSFVKDEIESKSQVINDLRLKDKNGNFSSLKSMMRYEMESELLAKSDYVSGCRTLLRLHRGLDFIRNFLYSVSLIGPTESVSSVGTKVYGETLGKFHPWYIRKCALIAMYLLPSRDALFNKVCGDEIEAALKILPKMLQVADEVYKRTETCYNNNDLLNLP